MLQEINKIDRLPLNLQDYSRKNLRVANNRVTYIWVTSEGG